MKILGISAGREKISKIKRKCSELNRISGEKILCMDFIAEQGKESVNLNMS